MLDIGDDKFIKFGMEQQNLKKQHEKAVTESLLKCLNSEDLYFNSLGNDKNEPDVIYKKGCKRVGIEVVSAYFDNRHAKYIWDYAKGKRKDFGTPDLLRENPDDLLCNFIKRVLKEKTRKSFDYFNVDDIWLCIEELSPVSDEDTINHCIEQIKIEKNGFNNIFILHNSPVHEGGNYKAFKLKK